RGTGIRRQAEGCTGRKARQPLEDKTVQAEQVCLENNTSHAQSTNEHKHINMTTPNGSDRTGLDYQGSSHSQHLMDLKDPGSTHTPNGSDRTGLDYQASVTRSTCTDKEGRKEIDKDNSRKKGDNGGLQPQHLYTGCSQNSYNVYREGRPVLMDHSVLNNIGNTKSYRIFLCIPEYTILSKHYKRSNENKYHRDTLNRGKT
ncbi:hypothetical protein L9F63_013673, partial [Diploptera punctata]